jgi:hypothetical protein
MSEEKSLFAQLTKENLLTGLTKKQAKKPLSPVQTMGTTSRQSSGSIRNI